MQGLLVFGRKRGALGAIRLEIKTYILNESLRFSRPKVQIASRSSALIFYVTAGMSNMFTRFISSLSEFQRDEQSKLQQTTVAHSRLLVQNLWLQV